MTEPAPLPALIVSHAEAGLKLLRFLERRLAGRTKGELHKWIRTGQVRVNGRRAKAFDILGHADDVRVPPFALLLPASNTAAPNETPPQAFGHISAPQNPYQAQYGPGLALVHAHDDYLVLNKAAGLAVQGGKGHTDNLAARLAHAFAGALYCPAPAHRLDRDTSGLLLAGRGALAQTHLHHLFRANAITKDYLALLAGQPVFTQPRLLADRLEQARLPGSDKEGMRALPGGLVLDPASPHCARQLASFIQHPKLPPPALCLVVHVATMTHPGLGQLCCVLVRLLTGRKHQIRVQLAAQGVPVLGDPRYGSGPAQSPMRLHAWGLRFAWPVSLHAAQDESAAALIHTADNDGISPNAKADAKANALQKSMLHAYHVLPNWPASLVPPAKTLNRAAHALDVCHNMLQPVCASI
jgi:Pseudouridylate synthases, 23S RNA-specific